MKHVLNTESVPIKMWVDISEVESKALEQAKNLANLPFAYKWIALMPDVHCGYGMPIGGVLATKDVVIPNAVGVDIGCGMCALQLPLTDITIDYLKEILGKIRRRVPTGFNHHKEAQDAVFMPGVNVNNIGTDLPVVQTEYNSALKQVGTLGGGNHFIEIQKGSDGLVWVMIHSGSRNIGYKVARHYNLLAKDLNKQWHAAVPSNWDLAFLPINSYDGERYLAEMRYCVDFAYCNRTLMMQRIISCFREVVPGLENFNYDWSDVINIAHNYATLEHHLGIDVMVHRKGATLAREGIKGIIPGSQGSKSYIVRGKGNPESFHSCSHGAGRKMSRTKAKAELSLEDEQRKLNDKGILHSVRGKGSLDEAPGAYKNIETVMEYQKDLVDIVVELEPLAVVKG